MSCRICFEDCDEPTQCLCKGYVHQACLDRWLDISGRHNCEICLHPLRDEMQEEEDELPVSLTTFFTTSQIAYNCTYAILLLMVQDWNYPVGMAFVGQMGMVIFFAQYQIQPENILLTGKWTNFLTLIAIFGVTNITPMRLDISVSKRDWRTSLVEIDAFLLVFIFLVRVIAGVLRATMCRDRLDN